MAREDEKAAMKGMEAFFPYAAQTRGLVVRVAVSFLADQSDPARGHWFWGYHIRIENQGPMPVQLMTRHWLITDAHGNLHEVEGEGVIGDQPVIDPGQSYDYVSGCPLHTPTGKMAGSYRMVAADGSSFDAAIPPFILNAATVAQ